MPSISIEQADTPWAAVSTTHSTRLDVSFDGSNGQQCLQYTNFVLDLLEGLHLNSDLIVYREQLDELGRWQPHLHIVIVHDTHGHGLGLREHIQANISSANIQLANLTDKEQAYTYYTKQSQHPLLKLEGWYFTSPAIQPDTPEPCPGIGPLPPKAKGPTSRGSIIQRTFLSVLSSWLEPFGYTVTSVYRCPDHAAHMPNAP